MTTPDPIAPLIPWYATGTLAPEEHARVEEHLAVCDDCRKTLAMARNFRRLASERGRWSLSGHVQAHWLDEFARDPASLEPDARQSVTDHTQSCDVCAEALQLLREVHQTGAVEERSGARTSRGAAIWELLRRTLLHPAPALGYLVALVAVLVLLPARTPAPPTDAPPGGASGGATGETPGGTTGGVSTPKPPTAWVVPPTVDLPAEMVFRGQGKPPEPMVVKFPAGATSVALTLVADIETADLGDPAAIVRVEIVQGERTLLEARRRASDFDRGSRLTVVIDPAALEAGTPCRARIVLTKPGDPRDGEEIYRRTFILSPESRPAL